VLGKESPAHLLKIFKEDFKMKKFLSALLAVAMIVSLSSVAFAAAPDYETGAAEEYTVKVEDGKSSTPDVFGPIVGMYGPFSYDAEDRALYSEVEYVTDKSVYGPVEFGEAAYYALINYVPFNYNPNNENDEEYEFEVTNTEVANAKPVATASGGNALSVVKDSEVVSNLKIKADWEEGGDLVKSIKVIKRKILNPTIGDTILEQVDDDTDKANRFYPSLTSLGLAKYGMVEEDYVYFLVVEYEESDSYNDADLIGTVTFDKSKDPKVDELEMDIGFAVDWEYNYRTPNSEWVIKDDPSDELLAEKNYALKFDADDEVEFTFEDESTFTVDVSGQSKILFNFNTNYIPRVAAKYPYAELNFWNGNGAKFNRVGEFFFNCEDLEGNQFLYQVNADGTLSEVPGAEWDDSDEGFYFNTRVLGSYVVSDMELDVATVQPSVSAPSAPAPVVTNPATGVEG